MYKKIFFFSIIMLFSYSILQGQELINVSGNLTDYQGKPIQSVRIAYSANGNYHYAYTDQKGYYSINVLNNSTIGYYYGYSNYSYPVKGVVTEYTQIPIKKTNKNQEEMPQKKGIAEMTNTTYINDYSYKKIYGLPVNSINLSINKFPTNIDYIYFDKSSQLYEIKTFNNYEKSFQIEINSSVSFELPNKLPELQNKYSQGINSTFDPNSLFSYGTKFENMEISAINPYNFFKTGINLSNSVNIFYKQKETKISFSYKNNSISGIVPYSDKMSNTCMLNIENIRIKKSKLDISGFFSDTKIDFPENAANYSRLMHAITTTPQNFDNNNELNLPYTNQAVNPYWIVNAPNTNSSSYYQNTNYDFNTMRKYWAKMDFTTNDDRFLYLHLKSSFNKTDEILKTGYKHFEYVTNGFYSEKDISQNKLFSEISLNQDNYMGDIVRNIENRLIYRINYDDIQTFGSYFSFNELYRNPSILMNTEDLTPTRFIQEVSFINELKFNFFYNDFNIYTHLNPSIYNSSSLDKKKIYFLPAAHISFEFNWWPLVTFLFISYSETVKEYPIYFNSMPFNSLTYNSNNFFGYNEKYYPTISENIEPENIKNFTSSISSRIHRFYLSIRYTKNWHKKALFPIYNSNFIYDNIADYTTDSWEFVSKFDWWGYKTEFSLQMIFEIPRTKVTKIYSEDNRIPYAGFADVSMNLIEGEPVGLIVGSHYLRNEKGEQIIGNDGFPIIADGLDTIANPNPDYILKLNSDFGYKKFSINCTFELRMGGEYWNGTSNVLNYYGTSAETDELRNTTDYIFEGVNLNGETNEIPVNLSEEFWFNNGFSGVAEDAIEDASNFRLRELSISYQSERIKNTFEFKFSLWVRNIILFSHYTGVDIETSLFAYQQTQALDMFNMPAVKSYGITLKLIF